MKEEAEGHAPARRTRAIETIWGESVIADLEHRVEELRAELLDIAAGRRRTESNAALLSIAIGLRLRLAQRSLRALGARLDALEGAWLALSSRIETDRVGAVAP